MSMEVSEGGGGESGQQQLREGRDTAEPAPAPFFGLQELGLWSFYRAVIAEFVATLLLLYVTVATIIGARREIDYCNTVGLLGIAWSFGGMIFLLVYCTAGISGGHINPAVALAFFVARKMPLIRALAYMVAQFVGAISGVAIVKGIMKRSYTSLGGGANTVAQWIFLVGPFVGALAAVINHQCIFNPAEITESWDPLLSLLNSLFDALKND